MEDNSLDKIRHFKGSLMDFKSFFDKKAEETLGKKVDTNAYDTPVYNGFNGVHPVRGVSESPHWKEANLYEAKFKSFSNFILEKNKEIFDYGVIRFDVDKAEEIIKKEKLKPELIDVKDWMNSIQIKKDSEGNEIWDEETFKKTKSMKISMGTGIDLKKLNSSRVKNAINEPGIIILYKHKTGDIFPILIDGNHRLVQRYLAGKKKMKVYVLEPEFTKEILI